MDIKDVFHKAQKKIEEEIEKARNEGHKEALEQLLLEDKTLKLYEQTTKYKEDAYFILAQAIQQDHLIQGKKISFEHGGREYQYMKALECNRCGAEVFNVLDQDYIELYEITNYCLECALCGKRTWYKLDKVEFEEILEVNDDEESEEYELCEQ